MRLMVCGVLFFICFVAASASKAQPTLPAFVLDRFDAPVDSNAIDANDRDTVAIYGDELDLKDVTVSAIRPPRQRAHDFVLVARTIKLGPGVKFYMQGLVSDEQFDLLRGGDLYLVADTLVLNGVKDDLLMEPVNVYREGGYHSTALMPDRARSGRILVFVNKVVLADEYIRIQAQRLNAADATSGDVPIAILKIMSRGFSAANSIHRAVADKASIPWSTIGDAYKMWLAEESVTALIVRELALSLKSTHPLIKADVVGSLADAIRFVPTEILSPWYLVYLRRSAGMAQAAVARQDYETAHDIIRKAKPFTATAPTAAITDTTFTSSVASLQASEQTLSKQSVAESLSFPIEGSGPVSVTVIRDLVAGRISVIPHQVLLSAILDNGELRLGFMRQEGLNVRVTMRGRLVVDQSVLDLVRTRFANPKSEIGVLYDEVVYDTINLGLGSALVAGAARVLGDGVVDFDLLLSGTQFAQTLVRLAQPNGIDATVNWRHKSLDFGNRTTRANVTLGRTEFSLMAQEGQLKNEFKHPVEIDYVVDGTQIIANGFPVRLTPGQTVASGCATKLCYSPGSAVRHLLSPTETSNWFMSIQGAPVVQQYTIENQLEDDPSRGGLFRAVALEVSFVSALGASPQRTGTFTLGPRGAPNAMRSMTFIGNPTGSGKLEISGRAYWGNGQSYYDIPSRTVEASDSSLTLIDSTWLRPAAR